MLTRQVYLYLKRNDGTPWDNAQIAFMLMADLILADAIYPASTKHVMTDSAGYVAVDLVVPEDGTAAPYEVRGSGIVGAFSLPAGAAIDLQTLLTTSSSTVAPSALQLLIDAHLAAADPHPQYLDEDRADARYDVLGAASGAVGAHVAAADPHPQYLFETQATQAASVTGPDGLYLVQGGTPKALTIQALLDLIGTQFAPAPYATKITDLFGESIVAYLPLDDAGGTVARDISGNGRHGAYNGPTLAAAPGPVYGTFAPEFDGSGDDINIYAACRAMDWETAGGILGWCKVPGAAWTDGQRRDVFSIYSLTGDNFFLSKNGTLTNNQLYGGVTYGGQTKLRDANPILTDWIPWAVTWSKGGDLFRVYVNGAQAGPDLKGLGTWVGELYTDYCRLGGFGGGATPWLGSIAHVVFLNRLPTATEIFQFGQLAIQPITLDVATFGAKTTTEEPGFDNTAIFKTCLTKAKNITISKAGTYLLSDTLMLSSGQTITGTVDGVVLKKSGVYCHMVSNRAAATNGAIRDADLILRNLTLDDNDLETSEGRASCSSNGIINLCYVDRVNLDGITVANGGANLYGLHLQAVAYSTITNYTYEGDKDGIHFSAGCHHVVVDGFDIASYDDTVAVIGCGYPMEQGNAQDIEYITIRNGTTHAPAGSPGYLVRLITGSWLAWQAGNTYEIGHIVVNAGNLYKMYNAGPLTAANAPVHTFERVTGADGIQWNWIGSASNTSTNIRHIYLHNITVSDGRTVFRMTELNNYSHTRYPGTDGGLLDDLHTSLSAGQFEDDGGSVLGSVYFDEVML
jgi:hypothetical protein